MDVCIVGSIRFRDRMDEISRKLEGFGISFSKPENRLPKERETPGVEGRLLLDYFRKIDKCRVLYVVNPGGYIGESVKAEIAYARGAKKRVAYMERTGSPVWDALVDALIGENELERLESL